MGEKPFCGVMKLYRAKSVRRRANLRIESAAVRVLLWFCRRGAPAENFNQRRHTWNCTNLGISLSNFVRSATITPCWSTSSRSSQKTDTLKSEEVLRLKVVKRGNEIPRLIQCHKCLSELEITTDEIIRDDPSDTHSTKGHVVCPICGGEVKIRSGQFLKFH